jgi:hypothetical protein
MNRLHSLMLLSVTEAMVGMRRGHPQEIMGSDMTGWGPCFPADFRPIPHGISWHPHRNQRQRRKRHRQTRPHGWKGGAE